ncbi:hypothetical protein AV530_009074 [Patagioenas fasciata monilis]|uniref:Uncharacterized protein n=1 Tax=Patagioenas fasciata monilis TaxID=372326 RepID=A0A1V4L0S7_PATFA|nr:hypothetical protein AV530_009074 [Patagioenas fasciata monilis]
MPHNKRVRERSKNVKQLCRHQVSEEGGGEGAPGARAKVTLEPMVKIMVRPAVPLKFMEVHSGAGIHLQPMEDPTLEQVDAQRRLRPHRKPTLEQASWQNLCILWKGPKLEQLLKNWNMRRTHAGEVHE